MHANRTPISGPSLVRLLGFLAVSAGFLAPALAQTKEPPPSPKSKGGDWSPAFYRSIPISNASDAALVDVQVKVELDASFMGNPYQNVLPKGSDIRFFLSDRKTEIPYWIESFDPTGISRLWVRVQDLPVGRSEIMMYYGDPSARAVSNGTDTFLFFDDFSGMSGRVPDISKWAVADPPVTVRRGKVIIGREDNQAVLESTRVLPAPFIVEYDYTPLQDGSRFSDFNHCLFGFRNQEKPIRIIFNHKHTMKAYENKIRIYETGVGDLASVPNPAIDHGKKYRIAITVDSVRKHIRIAVDGKIRLDFQALEREMTERKILLSTYRSQGAMDRYRVRKLVIPELQTGPIGEEVPLANYVLLSRPRVLKETAFGMKIGQAHALLAFDLRLINHANRKQTAVHWTRMRVDKFAPSPWASNAVPDEQIEVSIWVESSGNGRFDADDTRLGVGAFKEGKAWLPLKRVEIGTTARTFYIVYTLGEGTRSGQTAGAEVKGAEYFVFEEPGMEVAKRNF
jgi:hypothetical protein